MSTTLQSNKMSTKSLISWAVTLLLPLAILLFIPVTETFTKEIKLFLAITLCAILIFAFELLDNILPALLLPYLYALLKLAPMGTAFQPWTTSIPWMCIGGFLLANILDRTGLLKRMANWCIIKTGGTYKGIIWGITFFGILFNLAKPGASFVAMAAFAYGICKAFDLGKSKASAGIMIAAAFATLVPGYFIYTPTNVGLLLGIGNSVVPLTVTYFDFMKENIVFVPFIFITTWLLTKMFKPETSIDGKSYFLAEQAKLGKMSLAEKKTAIATICLFVYLLTSSWHKLDVGFGFILFPVLLCLPFVNVGTKEDIAKINYSFVVFIAACMSIGSVATALGVGKLISAGILPYMSNFNNITVVGFVWILGVVLNFLLTPLAAMSTFGAPLAQIAVDLNMNPYPLMYAFYYGLDQIILPYEHAQYMMFFSFGLFALKDFIKAFAMKMALNFVYLMLIAVPYWHFIGLFN